MKNTKKLVLTAILTALSLLIPLYSIKLPLPQPFSVTLAAHVPVIISMFFGPVVGICTVLGGALGFLISLGPIVALRAASHLLFVLVGAYLLKRKWNFILVFAICAILHGIGEVLVVWAFTPLLMPGAAATITWSYLAGTVFGITVFHHAIDCVLSVIVLMALNAAKLTNVPLFKKKA